MTLAADVQPNVAPHKRVGFLERRPTLARLLRHRAFLAGAILFGFVLLVAVFADVIAQTDPTKLSVRNRFKPPSLEHPFGTDNVGRSQVSRIVHGARVSLAIGFAVVLLTRFCESSDASQMSTLWAQPHSACLCSGVCTF